MRFPFETDPVPQLEVQQSPDAVVVVAMFTAMFAEKTLNCFAPKVATIEGPRLEQHLPDCFQSRSGKPSAPGCGKPQFGAVNDCMRQKVFHRFLKNCLSRQPFDL